MKTNILKTATSIFAVAALAFALTNPTASACEGKASCAAHASAKDKAACNATQASKKTGKSSCSMAGKKCARATTTASADASGAKMMMADSKNCPLANGTYSVAAYKVDGLTCGGCEINLTNAFEAADGVVMVPTVSYTDGSAKVIYDPTLTNADALTKVISDAGYKGEIVPAVATTTGSSDKSKATCSAKGATAKANGSAACPHATKGANATTASAAGCSSACSQLTSAEREAFCNKFCKSHKKSDKKSKDI